ncbi:pyridoxal phosphate-dependent aminotransferase [Halorarum halophilum]|uniref:Aminotransferase n=1 Tax=Halorarum halophilum TaxID=2743090 RepID=A0A7D5H1U8_9EURY|nr:pyridoxal phosphate-dependent aminotransferase [Halobaculum halophilum]QLG28753.1 pyridoxal phosphate-dependent aminotransferase [Halobaculum halophilum]
MPRPTARVRSCDRSRIRVMFDLADEAEREGRDPVRLEVGEPDFDTPEHITEAAVDALRGGATHYTSNAGLLELREAIADTLDAEYGVEQTPDEVLVTTGGMEALHLAVLATVEQGEELLIPSPAWPNYWTQARLADADPVEVPMAAPDYDLDAERVIDRMGPDTGAVVLCSPSNPTGRVADPDEVRAIVEAAAEHDAYVISDEVYGALTYDRDPEGVASMTGNPEHVLTVGSCSKAFAMTGWRVGWLAGTADVVDETTKVRESTTCCAPTMAQHGALAALTGPRDPVEEMYEAFRERRDYVADRLEGMDGVTAPRPEGAFYAFLEPNTDEASLPLAKRLLEDGDVVLAPGDGFGDAGRGQLRLSFANSLERLELGLDRIEETI